VGLYLDAYLAIRLYTLAYGTPIEVRVGVPYTTQGKGENFHVPFRYVMGGQIHGAIQEVTIDAYQRVSPGSVSPGRALQFGGRCFVVANFGDTTWQTTFQTAIIVVWNLVWAIGIYTVCLRPIRERWLVRHGYAAGGVVADRRDNQRSVTSIHYVANLVGGEVITGKAAFVRKQHAGLSTGQHVTVIYDPTNRKRNLAYEYCDFEIVR
jgi:hypothetical protein